MNAVEDDGSLAPHTQQTLARLAPIIGAPVRVSKRFSYSFLTLIYRRILRKSLRRTSWFPNPIIMNTFADYSNGGTSMKECWTHDPAYSRWHWSVTTSQSFNTTRSMKLRFLVNIPRCAYNELISLSTAGYLSNLDPRIRTQTKILSRSRNSPRSLSSVVPTGRAGRDSPFTVMITPRRHLWSRSRATVSAVARTKSCRF